MASGQAVATGVIGRGEVIGMTQIKLLVVMPVIDDGRDDKGPREVPFTEHVNAVLTFGDGWVLHASQPDYAQATAEGYALGGAADDPPVREAVECLTKAAAREPGPEPGDGGESDTEAARAHAHREVLEFQVPEGSRSVRARVVPKVTVEDGEIHARVEVEDPNWIRDTEAHDTQDRDTQDRDSEQ
jgi:hypothetical protein